MKKKLLLSYLLLYFLSGYSIAQTQDRPAPCKVNGNPLEITYSNARTNTQEKYTIPVVVHVFGNDESDRKKVSYELIKNALKTSSEDFKGLRPDWADDKIDSDFEKIKKALNIDFVLAKKDPEGNTTTGVIFHPENEKGFGEGNGYDSKIKKYAWDNYRYMNVYIMHDLYNDGKLNYSGVAWYPNTSMSDNNTARVVYNGNYVGSNTDENFRSVLTHEFGHWLNLAHTFEGGCSTSSNSGDGVSDTPAVDDNTNKTQAIENCKGETINWQNFMDYTKSYTMFTEGQVNRMLSALNHSTRKPLWQEVNLIQTGVIPDEPVVLFEDNLNIKESLENDGSLKITEAKLLTFGGASFNDNIEELKEGTHYTIDDLPEGLQLSLDLIDNKKIQFKIEGKALIHEAVHSNDSLKINFLDPLIKGGVSSLSSSSVTFGIKFNDPYTEYCTPSPLYQGYGHISEVSIENSEDSTLLRETSKYETYSSHKSEDSVKLILGNSYTVTVKTNIEDSGSSDKKIIRLWLDYNHDFHFSESERHDFEFAVKDADENGDFSHSFEITIPKTANLAKTRMRVSFHHKEGSEGENACGSYDSGETEDYRISIYDPQVPLVGKLESILPEKVQLGSEVVFLVKDYPIGTSFNWILFDGSGFEALGNQDSVNHIFTTPGTYLLLVNLNLGVQKLTLETKIDVINDFDIDLITNNNISYLLGETAVLTASKYPEDITSFKWEVFSTDSLLHSESSIEPVMNYSFIHPERTRIKLTATVDKKEKVLEKEFEVKKDFKLELTTETADEVILGTKSAFSINENLSLGEILWTVKTETVEQEVTNNSSTTFEYDFKNPGNFQIIATVTLGGITKTVEKEIKVLNVLSTEQENKATLVSAFPNPSDNFIKIQVQEKTAIKIYQNQGQLVFFKTLKNTNRIDVRNWEKGLYILRAENSKGNQSLKIRIK